MKRLFIIFALYSLFAVVMTWPVTMYFTTQMAGSGGDPWQTLWRFAYKEQLLQQAWENDTLSAFLTQEFFGGGSPQLVNLSVWPWLPLYTLFEPPIGYNLIWLLSFSLSGLSMYVLTRKLISQEIAMNQRSEFSQEIGAFMAGLVYMFLPYHVAHAYGHFGAMQLQWLPLLILCLWYVSRSLTIKAAVAFGLLLTMQAWTEHHYALWFTVFAILFLIFYRGRLRKQWQEKAWRQRRWWLAPGILLVTIGLGVVLPYVPTIRLAKLETQRLALGQEQIIRFSADFFSYIVPASFHPLWGNVSQALFTRRFTGNLMEATHFLGIIPLLLLLFFHQRLPFQFKRFWVGVAILFLLLSLGPRLHVVGNVTPVPLPYAVLENLPLFSSVRTVARASVMVGLSLSVLLACIIATQLRRTLTAGVILGLIILEFLFLPVPTQTITLSPAYAMVANAPGKAFIELPAATNYTAASRALFASLIHGKEVVGDIALERGGSPEYYKNLRSLPALRQLLYVRTTDLREGRPDFFAQNLAETLPDVLHWLDVGAIMIHTDSLSILQVASVRHFLETDVGLKPEVTPDAIVYQVPKDEARPTDKVFLLRHDGWTIVTYDQTLGHKATIERAAEVTIINTDTTDRLIELSFALSPASYGNLIIMRGDEVIPQLDMSDVRVRAEVKLSPGENKLRFINRLPDPIIIQHPQWLVR